MPHLPARAKRVIFLCMEGGPSHVDSFDYKPKMNADAGKPIGKGRAAAATLLASPWKFNQHGQSGLWVSDLFPEVAKKVDDLCIINGMHTDIPNHPQAFLQMHTGLFNFPRPSIGAWVLYGLGTENENLPGFITLCPPINNGGASNYGSSFLPAIYQGTQIGQNEQPIANAKVSNLANPKLSRDAARRQLDYVQTLNRQALERDQVNPAVEGVIESYELAFRMQARAAGGDGPGKGVEGDPGAVRHRHDRRPTTSAGNASWPAASPRPACGSSRSATAAGISIASSSKTTASTPPPPTCRSPAC